MALGISDRECTFLIDSGATTSTFKINKLINNFPFNKHDTCSIRGVGAGVISTLGTANSNLILGGIELNHNFRIVPENFPVPGDGILGLDFLKKFNCKIDYNNSGSNLFIRPGHTYSIVLPIFDSPVDNYIALPARSEVIRKISVEGPCDEIYVPNQEISPGIYVARSIVSKNSPYVRMVNTNDENKLVSGTVKSESLSNYNVYTIDGEEQNTERKTRVLEKLTKNFPEFVKLPLINLCTEYADVFALETDRISANNFYSQTLKMVDTTPVYIKNYRIPHTQKSEIEKQVKKLINDGIVEPSNSAYNSPILIVPKKSLPGSDEKRWRMVIDYRQINKKLVADKFPLPRIDDILDQLGRARYFSCLDLMSGFHQIALEESSRDMTSFSTERGSFRFTRLPYGLKIAPNSFQRMMTIAFSGLTTEKAFLYMDDLMVIAPSENQMLKNLREVFTTFRKFNLKLHPDKCVFFKHETTFLGHKCTNVGILPDESKFSIIRDYPKPTDADGARRFIAFCNYYRRFTPNFAEYSRHITKLTKKNVKFHWTAECEMAFQYLKTSLLDPKILKYPDFKKRFCVTTDASKFACGAILSQEYEGIQLPIAYASRSFTRGESNKSVIEQELAAIHWALNHFKPYLFGTKFIVKSDHKPLTYLFSMKNPSSKLTRMRLDLEEFDFEVEYIKGKDNVGADALSRLDFSEIRDLLVQFHQMYPLTRAQIKRNLLESETQRLNINNTKPPETNRTRQPQCYEALSSREVKTYKRLQFVISEKTSRCVIRNGRKLVSSFEVEQYFENGVIDLGQLLPRLEIEAGKIFANQLQLSLNDNIFNYVGQQSLKIKANELLKNLFIVLTPKYTIITDDEEKIKIIQKYHDDPILGGHVGTRRLIEKLKQFCRWKFMIRDVTRYVRACKHCQTNKSLSRTKEKLTITNTPQNVFDIVIIDTIGPLIKSYNDFDYAITIMCDLSKYLVTIPIKGKSAKATAKAIFENFILIFGPMKRIVSDMGTEYKNEVVTELCKLLKIEHLTSTAYHHQTVGTIERSHRTFNEYIRSYLSDSKMDWDEWLLYFTYCFNTTPSTVHGYCPFELVFGKSPNIFDFLKSGNIDPLYNVESYDKEIKYRLQTSCLRARNKIIKTKEKQKITYDNKSKPIRIEVNDLVLLRNEAAHKLEPLYEGPYKVKSISQPNCTIINEKNKEYVVHSDRLKRFNSYHYHRFLTKI